VNLRYTARYGGDALRDVARKAAVLPARPAQSFSGSKQAFPAQANLQRLFSLRHEYPTEWYKFLNPPGGGAQSMQLPLGTERFPYQYRGKKIVISSVEFVFVPSPSTTPSNVSLSVSAPGGATPSKVTLNVAPGLLNGAPYGSLSQPPQPAPPTGQTAPPVWVVQAEATISPTSVSDIFMICPFTP
jgi:hypothetical protein